MSEGRSALAMKHADCPLGRISWPQRLDRSVDFVPDGSCGAQNAGMLISKTRRNSPQLYCIEQVEDIHLISVILLVKPYERLIILATLFIRMR